MAEKTFVEEIETTIERVANNNPAPEKCTITKNYSDSNFVDIKTETGDEMKTVPLMGNNTVGKTAIVIFLEGKINKPFVICIWGYGYESRQ